MSGRRLARVCRGLTGFQRGGAAGANCDRNSEPQIAQIAQISTATVFRRGFTRINADGTATTNCNCHPRISQMTQILTARAYGTADERRWTGMELQRRVSREDAKGAKNC
jgi:hypothetical protein